MALPDWESLWLLSDLLMIHLLVKSMTGEEIARELIVISAKYGIFSNNLVAAMHDCAACNGVTL